MLRLAALAAAIAIGLIGAGAQAAGLRLLDMPADPEGPALTGAVWSPCAQPPGQVTIGRASLPAVQDCPVPGQGRLPLIVVSHGHGGSFLGHHDTAETLADAGFVAAAINHPGDTASDMSRGSDLLVMIERPIDIKRLIDFMLGTSPLAPRIDPQRIGFFGFSRAGYTGLVLVGANPDWDNAIRRCEGASLRICEQLRNREFPAGPLTHDPRIKAAVIADPLTVFFTPKSFASITAPVQLWGSAAGGEGVAPESVAVTDKSLPSQHEYRIVPNSTHFAFLTPCSPAVAQARPSLCTDPPGFDRVAFHHDLDAAILGFFQKHLPSP